MVDFGFSIYFFFYIDDGVSGLSVVGWGAFLELTVVLRVSAGVVSRGWV